MSRPSTHAWHPYPHPSGGETLSQIGKTAAAAEKSCAAAATNRHTRIRTLLNPSHSY